MATDESKLQVDRPTCGKGYPGRGACGWAITQRSQVVPLRTCHQSCIHHKPTCLCT